MSNVRDRNKTAATFGLEAKTGKLYLWSSIALESERWANPHRVIAGSGVGPLVVEEDGFD